MAATVISTPSRLSATPFRSTSGAVGYTAKEIDADLAIDIAYAQRPDIDHLLAHFLALTLESDDETKIRLDNLQTEIEEKQHARYYASGTTPADPADATMPENPESLPDDERVLLEERQKILTNLLETALDNVLGVANDKQIRQHLRDLNKAKKEEELYAPYVKLCNDSLKQLGETSITSFEFRAPSSLELCFLRNETKNLTASYKDVQQAVKRKPDIVATSRVAAADALRLHPDDENLLKKCSQDPPSKEESCFTWEQLLMAIEFKFQATPKRNLSRFLAQNHKFEKTVRVEVETECDEWLDAEGEEDESSDDDMPIKTDISESDVSQSSARKRGPSSHIVSDKKPKVRRVETLRDESVTSTSKTSDTSATSTPVPESKSQKGATARVQCATYGLEMLSHNLGVHHGISLLIINDVLWVWYYDRQGIIHSTNMSIIQDLPRFLVLLFAFQRFELEDWGIVRVLNPNAENVHSRIPRDLANTHVMPQRQLRSTTKPLDQPGQRRQRERRTKLVNVKVDDLADWYNHPTNIPKIESIELNLSRFLSPQPHCLAGRATAVVGATAVLAKTKKQVEMVCKISHPEVQRSHEGTILKIVHRIAESRGGGKMTKHLPTMYFYADLPGFTTNRIRSMVRLSWRGHRTTRLIGMKKLDEMKTVRTVEQRLGAWFEVVTCHAFLWKNHVEHGDPSLNNMMFDPELQCGVLTDFDLALCQWMPRLLGTDRTGTIPFMAIDLLSEDYWKGLIQRRYHHELESFIWVVPFLVLTHQDGKRVTNTYIDKWRTSNFDTCREKKNDFLQGRGIMDRVKSTVPPGNFDGGWIILSSLCAFLRKAFAARYLRGDCALPEEDMLPIPKSIPIDAASSNPSHSLDSRELWNGFVDILHALSVHQPLKDQFKQSAVELFESFCPPFAEMTAKQKADMEEIARAACAT